MLTWSWKLGRIAGIPIYVHWTFLILLGWILYAGFRAGGTTPQVLLEVAFVLSIFGCVVLHELGHAMMARRFGVPTADITLLPIGGVARLQRMPEKPSEELLVAIAGPLVNVAIAALLLAIGIRLPLRIEDETMFIQGDFLSRLLLVNILLVGFNLLPAFPMDGGRMLRALLAMATDYGRATRIAASIGQMMALLFVFLGLTIHNPLLLLIALFVWIGAGAEAAQVQQRLELQGIPVREAMLTDYYTLAPDDTLGHAAELLLSGSQHDFPIIEAEQIAGVLTREALMRGLAEAGRSASVASYGVPQVGSVEIVSELIPAVALLREGDAPMLQVIDRGRTVGILTLENIAEYLMIRAALSERRERTATAAG